MKSIMLTFACSTIKHFVIESKKRLLKLFAANRHDPLNSYTLQATQQKKTLNMRSDDQIRVGENYAYFKYKNYIFSRISAIIFRINCPHRCIISF